jgi:uncharacterized protein (TIGR03435 family)
VTHRIVNKLGVGRSLVLAIAGLTTGLTILAGPPAFEVASVRQDKAGGDRRSLIFGPGGITFTNVNLRDCIRAAYVVKDFQISAGSQLSNDRYDIVAKATGPASEDQLREMLQGLLADRFNLKLHRETKELSMYALVVGKNGPKLQQAAGDGAAGTSQVDGGLVFRNFSMSDLADRLSRMRGFGVDRPVLDKTSLKGAFDFTLKLADNNADLHNALEGHGEPSYSLFTLLQQVGLKLEPQKGPVEILIIDHAEKPTEN